MNPENQKLNIKNKEKINVQNRNYRRADNIVRLQ